MLFGIDAASVDDNKHPNWSAAKANGPASFAILRGTYGAFPDSFFAPNWGTLKEVGLVRGAYLFLVYPRPGKPAPPSAEDQARAFIAAVGELEATDLPPILDLEFPGGRAETGLSVEEALSWAGTAWAVLRDEYGAAPILYTSARVWREDLGDSTTTDFIESPLWLARYDWKENIPAVRDAALFAGGRLDPPVPSPWGDAFFIHQYQGDAVDFPGMTSTVDCNRFNTLFEGASGDAVRWVQRRAKTAESGQFDAATKQAVIAVQVENGLVPDGIVGPRTFACLCWK